MRIAATLASVARLERHQPSGMFYNWYDPATGAKLTTWPVDGNPVYPFLSSVDNGWMAAALLMVSNAVPQLRDQARDLLAPMDFGSYYDPAAGLLRGGFWVDPPGSQCTIPVTTATPACSTPATTTAPQHRAAHRQLPRHRLRPGPGPLLQDGAHLPGDLRLGLAGAAAGRVTRTYLGVEVFEGHYRYRGMEIVPSWGGSMFEALMVPLLVPEARWGPRSWGVNHPLYVRAQIEHGLEEAGDGYWGFSPSNNPSGGYREYGVDAIGLNPDGYASNNDNTLVDYGFGDCRPAQPLPPPPTPTGS